MFYTFRPLPYRTPVQQFVPTAAAAAPEAAPRNKVLSISQWRSNPYKRRRPFSQAAPVQPIVCPQALGPGSVDISTQGTIREANSDATIVSQIAASSAGDTVRIADGSYGYITTTKVVTGGTVRIVPANAGAVTLTGVDMTDAAGLDWRGINTDHPDWNVWFQRSSRCSWRGGNHDGDGTNVAFTFQADADDCLVEDATVRDALVSFNINSASYATEPLRGIIRRFRSENVVQDHVFASRGSDFLIQQFECFGHTESAQHSDGVQVVGARRMMIERFHIWNTRSFRDGATDQNDHGILINYDDVEADRVPEDITIRNGLIHDQTSTGLSVAGCRGLRCYNVTSYDNGPSGSAAAVNMTPDTGNIIDDVEFVNNVLDERIDSGVTYIVNDSNFVADGSGTDGTNALSGAPGFVNQPGQDYRLASGSQLLDSGSSTGLVTVDIFNCLRKVTDRGAFEGAIFAPHHPVQARNDWRRAYLARHKTRVSSPSAVLLPTYVRPVVYVTQQGDRRASQVRSRFVRHKPDVAHGYYTPTPTPSIKQNVYVSVSRRQLVRARAFVVTKSKAPISIPWVRPKVLVIQRPYIWAFVQRRELPVLVSPPPPGYYRAKIYATDNAKRRAIRTRTRVYKKTLRPFVEPQPFVFRPRIYVEGRAVNARNVRAWRSRDLAKRLRARSIPTATPLVRDRVVQNRAGRYRSFVRSYSHHKEHPYWNESFDATVVLPPLEGRNSPGEPVFAGVDRTGGVAVGAGSGRSTGGTVSAGSGRGAGSGAGSGTDRGTPGSAGAGSGR